MQRIKRGYEVRGMLAGAEWPLPRDGWLRPLPDADEYLALA